MRHFNSQNAITSQIYQRFNPAPELSRGQRSLPTISREASGLAARLAQLLSRKISENILTLRLKRVSLIM